MGLQVAPEVVDAAFRRLYELTVGFVRAAHARTSPNTPATKCRASRDRPMAPSPEHRFAPVVGSWSDACAWQPLPVPKSTPVHRPV